jgi:hypothetical protein
MVGTLASPSSPRHKSFAQHLLEIEQEAAKAASRCARRPAFAADVRERLSFCCTLAQVPMGALKDRASLRAAADFLYRAVSLVGGASLTCASRRRHRRRPPRSRR